MRLDSEGEGVVICCMPHRGCCCCFCGTGCCCFDGALIPLSHPVVLLLLLFGSFLAEMAVEAAQLPRMTSKVGIINNEHCE